MRAWHLARTTGLLSSGLLLSLAGCSEMSGDRSGGGSPEDPSTPAVSPSVTSSPTPAPTPTLSAPVSSPTGPVPSDGSPQEASLSIPKIGLENLTVIPYEGRPDDAPGTRIQDQGQAASPYGPQGGVGPGGVGNHIVTAHRTSSTRAFDRLPELSNGDRVSLVSGGVTYVYEIVETRETSFRSEESRRRQEAAVPGQPGVEPTRAMITLSTCATQEDHAAGNYWSDEFGNPEHRIDKIGVLVETR